MRRASRLGRGRSHDLSRLYPHRDDRVEPLPNAVHHSRGRSSTVLCPRHRQKAPLHGHPLADGARFLCASPPAALVVRPVVCARAAKSARSPPVSGPEARLVDAVGTRHAPARRDARIVSLVPSITELVCDLGLAAQLVGRTGFCVHPREVVRRIPKVGGTTDVDLDKLALYRLIGGIFGREDQAEALCGEFEAAYAALQTAARAFPLDRVLYLIWKNPWMTVSRDT